LASRPSSSPTLTTAYSTRKWFVKPRFGTRRWMGICPPSNPMKFMLPVRAFWPLPPRPAVLPSPLAWPRPTRFFSFTPPPAGGVNLVSSFISHLLNYEPRRREGAKKPKFFCFASSRLRGKQLVFCRLRCGCLARRAAAEGLECFLGLGPFHQIRDLVDHPADGLGVLQHALAAHPGEAQAAQRLAVALLVAAHAADQLSFQRPQT